MVTLEKSGAYLLNGTTVIPDTEDGRARLSRDLCRAPA